MITDLHPAAHPTLAGTLPRLLLVEDEPLIRFVAAEEISALGFDVVQAGSVAEAKAQLDLVGDGLTAAIVDLGLPGPDGGTVVDYLRSADPELLIIVTTGYSHDGPKSKWAGDSRIRWVEKPYDCSDLVAIITELSGKLGPRVAAQWTLEYREASPSQK